MFDVCVIGHITRDRVRIRDREKELPGGVAYYSSLALKSLGLNVCVITKCAEKDTVLLNDLAARNVVVFRGSSGETTTFENIYRGDLSSREQTVGHLAEPFGPRDIPYNNISTHMFHVGPLTENDLSPEILRGLSERSRVSLDVQGFVRRVEKGRIKHADWKEKDEGLSHVQILKANEREAKILSGEEDIRQAAINLSRYGVDEIIVTLGSKGSLIYSRGKFYPIPSFVPKRTIDVTGCGDTYMAGYLFKRLRTGEIEDAGRFAAAIASLKLERYGAFEGTAEDVHRFVEVSSTGNG